MTHRIAVFGKGGIGKSTCSANLAAVYARLGKKVLLIGCDPKHDTTVALTDGRPIPTVVDQPDFMGDGRRADRLVVRGRLGVDCVEAGGPEPGIGCAGRGISRMVDILEQGGLLEDGRHDVQLYDVLGDVVCGGFAAPLRQGLADKVCVVVSEELMALYAANNIARAIKNYSANGARLCGLIANVRDADADRAMVERFAALIGTRVLCFLPRDPAVRQAEFKRVTVVEHAPDGAIAAQLTRLAEALLTIDPRSCPTPTPLADEAFHELSRSAFTGPAPKLSTECARAHSVDKSPASPRQDQDLPKPGGEPFEARGRRDEALERDLALAGERRPGPDGVPGVPRPGPDGVPGVPRPGPDGAPSPQGPQAGPNARQWGGEDQWRRFFCDEEARRNARSGLESGGPVLMLRHQDLECDFATPDFEADLPSFFNFPWPKRPRRGGRPPEGDRRDGPPEGERRDGPPEAERRGPPPEGENREERGGGGGNMTTNLGDQDVIRGGGARLRRALEGALEASEGVEAIVVQSTCVPTVIGDDAESLISEFRGRTEVPILYANPADNREARVAQTLFSKLKDLGRDRRRDRQVNLVGFPEGRALDELAALLERAGVSVNARALPRLSVEQARRWLEAPVQVLYPNAAYEPVYAEAFRPLDIETLAPEAPYGSAGTKAWLLAVAGRFGLEAQAARAFEEAAAPLAAEWREGRRRARGHRLAFVVDAEHVRRLSAPAELWGIPMVRLLGELGFGVDVLLFGEGRGALRGFKTEDELGRLLAEGAFSAVYSEYFFDRRLTRAGKAQFSVAHFEPGLQGALRTLERLNGLCAWPFYRRYGKYLGGGR